MDRPLLNKMLDLLDNGVLRDIDIVEMCLKRMSESEILDMCEANDISEMLSDDDDSYDDSMDGDHDSAMASAGWGTDEDYGYYGED